VVRASTVGLSAAAERLAPEAVGPTPAFAALPRKLVFDAASEVRVRAAGAEVIARGAGAEAGAAGAGNEATARGGGGEAAAARGAGGEARARRAGGEAAAPRAVAPVALDRDALGEVLGAATTVASMIGGGATGVFANPPASSVDASKSTAAVISTPSLVRRDDRMTASSPSCSRTPRSACRMSRAVCRMIFIYLLPYRSHQTNLAVVRYLVPGDHVQVRQTRP